MAQSPSSSPSPPHDEFHYDQGESGPMLRMIGLPPKIVLAIQVYHWSFRPSWYMVMPDILYHQALPSLPSTVTLGSSHIIVTH